MSDFDSLNNTSIFDNVILFMLFYFIFAGLLKYVFEMFKHVLLSLAFNSLSRQAFMENL